MTGAALVCWLLRRAFYGVLAALVALTVLLAIIGLAVTIRP